MGHARKGICDTAAVIDIAGAAPASMAGWCLKRNPDCRRAGGCVKTNARPCAVTAVRKNKRFGRKTVAFVSVSSAAVLIAQFAHALTLSSYSHCRLPTDTLPFLSPQSEGTYT